MHSDSFRIKLDYYALFRACAGKCGEELTLDSADPARLYDDLMKKYRFPLDRSLVHLAVNDAYASWDMPLSPGDRVVFVPPVSGG
jgi:molybdopterin converting factor small subunit